MTPALTNGAIAYTDERGQTGRSGYLRIRDYLRVGNSFSQLKVDSSLAHRAANYLLRKKAITSWYTTSSLLLEKRIWRSKDAISFCHFLWADRDLGFLANLPGKNRLPLIGTFHLCPDDFQSVLLRPKSLQGLDAVILMSETQRSSFINAGVSPEKLHVIHHGIDTQHFRPAVERSFSRDRFEIIHVGSYRRNFEDLVQVCSALRDDPTMHFTIIASKSVIHNIPRLPNLTAMSGVTDDALLKAYQDSDCLLMTAEAATANNAVLEAIACGLPVVAQEVGGIPEYTGKACAFLHEPGDISGIVASLKTLQSNRKTRHQMGVNARNRAIELDWRSVADRTMGVYERVLASRQDKKAEMSDRSVRRSPSKPHAICGREE